MQGSGLEAGSGVGLAGVERGGGGDDRPATGNANMEAIEMTTNGMYVCITVLCIVWLKSIHSTVKRYANFVIFATHFASYF